MFERLSNKLKLINKIVNNAEYLKELQINTYCNSLINNLIGEYYLPRTEMSIRPYALSYILNEIVLNERRNIIEFGSGISTILIARLAYKNKLNIQITSIDEDKGWIIKIKRLLKNENLDANIKLIHAPLVNNVNDKNHLWYDTIKLENECNNEKYDLAIVDGPKAFDNSDEIIRGYALKFLKEKFGNTWAIFLDDAQRRGEREIINRWENEFKIKFLINNNFAVAYKGNYLISNPI